MLRKRISRFLHRVNDAVVQIAAILAASGLTQIAADRIAAHREGQPVSRATIRRDQAPCEAPFDCKIDAPHG